MMRDKNHKAALRSGNRSDRLRQVRLGLAILAGTLSLTSCTTVKPYQRVYLNDSEMMEGSRAVSGTEEYVQSIREGSSGGETGKGSGGCGCN